MRAALSASQGDWEVLSAKGLASPAMEKASRTYFLIGIHSVSLKLQRWGCAHELSPAIFEPTVPALRVWVMMW